MIIWINMEWYHVIIVLLLLLLVVGLGVLIACMVGGQPVSCAIQRRQPNHELTQIQQEEEKKRQKKFGARMKRAFSSSSEPARPLEPVEDVKTVELTFKFGDKDKREEQQQVTMPAETEVVLLPQLDRVTQAELDRRQKKREEYRKKI